MDQHDLPEGWTSWRAVKTAAARPTIWIATWVALSVMALSVALPWQAWFAEATAHRYAPGELARSLSETFRFDHGRAMSQLDAHTAQSGALLAVGAMLLGVFSAGGWLFLLLEPNDGRRLRRFLSGGARYFWRFARVWFVSMVLLGAWYWVLHDDPWDTFVLTRWLQVPEHDHARLESLHSELHVLLLRGGRDLLFGLGFAFVLAWSTYARTRLALLGRFSACNALLGALGSILRRPVRTLRPFAALGLLELLVVSIALGWAVRGIDTRFGSLDSWLVVLALFLVGQLAVLLRELARGARYAAALEVLRSTRPVVEEPTRSALGGPGGPQYPLDDLESGDGFGAAV